MFTRIARVVGNLFTVVDDTKPSNRVRLACESLEDRCTPSDFTVNTAGDGSDASPNDGKAGYTENGFWVTSLRSAIEQSNFNAGKGDKIATISFDRNQIKSNVIEMKNGHFQNLEANYKFVVVTAMVDGDPSPPLLVIARPANATERHRIFTVSAGWRADISDLGMTGGDTGEAGGGIKSSGTLLLNGCAVFCDSSDGYGGGIWTDGGSLSVYHSSIYLNQTGQGGGGIASSGSTNEMNIYGTDVYENFAALDGGGIYSTTKGAWIVETRVFGNTATLTGGGIYAARGGEISGGEIRANTSGGNGGGLYIDVPTGQVVTLVFATLTSNHSGGKGGGFYLKAGRLQIDLFVAFTGNTATLGGAGGMYLAPAVIQVDQPWPSGSQSFERDLG